MRQVKNSYISILKKSALLYCRVLFFAIAVCCGKQTPAQIPAAWSYRFYNSSHGLPSSEIICLAKDNKGFLWLGTSAGLSMYDGYNFQNHPYSKEGEWIGYVNVIRADTGNRLWIGSGAGLFCFVNNEIIKISAASASPQGVNDILIPQDGTIWLATENGPVHFNIKEADIAGIKKISLTDFVLPQWPHKTGIQEDPQALLISKAKDETIFIAQSNNLFRLRDNKLDLIHSTKGRDRISSLFPVSKSKIYFDAVETELNKIEDGMVTGINPEKLYKPGESGKPLGIWYTGTRGLFCFHPETGTVSAYNDSIDDYTIWPSAVLEENDFLWVASHDGLLKVKHSIFSAYPLQHITGYNDYYSITALKNGSLLLGANRGNIYVKKGDAFDLYKEQLVSLAEITAIYEDDRGWLWATTGYQGLVLVRNGKTERYTIENGLHDNSNYQFLKTSGGRLFVIGDHGMSEITVTHDKTVSFKKFLYEANTTRYAKFYSAIEAPDGNIWMGGQEGIVYLENAILRKFILNDRQLSVNSLIKDKEGNIWIAASGQGILKCRFNKKNELEIIKQFSENDGLNTLHYLNLLSDTENNIWAASSKGLSFIGQYGANKDRILNFDESDGFIKPGYSYIRLLQVGDSTIWAASSLGFMSFKPDQLLVTHASPVVYITGIKQIKTTGVSSGKNSNTYPAKNKFSYSDNSFNFSFTALDYANQENVLYYYKLDGLDTNWTHVGTQRSISFENLSPGKYSFRVKALNSKGTWSKQDAVYTFIITAPFWQSWWFIALLAATIGTFTFFTIKRRISFIKKREAEKTELQKLKAEGYQAQLETEQIINHFTNSISGQNTVDDMLWDVAKNLIGKMGFEDCMIYLWNPGKTILIQKAGYGIKGGMQAADDISKYHVPKGKGITGATAESKQSILVNDTSKDSRYFTADDKIRLSELCVPIIHNNETLGVINTEHSEKDFFTGRHLQILTTIASTLADKIDMLEAQQQTREKEIELLKLNEDLATSQLTALRTQMNPHFIFNALNSVQQFILQGDVVEANKYLSKFSKLQREILHYSNHNFISLEKEIEMLQSYLQLEQLRFGESFSYAINITDEIDPAEIRIPPMMMQPFVENAIWHGLMPKQGEKDLKIYFTLHNDDILLAIIQDNGIGREASAKLKQNNGGDAGKHQSKGMSMVQQRMQLLQQQYGKLFEVMVSDMTDVTGTLQGTRVALKIFIGNK